MKKVIVLCTLFLVLGMTGVAGAVSKYIYDGGLGTWQDADKTSYSTTADPDGLLCWAAAASNALSWAGWTGLQSNGVTRIATADDIFSYFVDSWPNNTGNVMYGYDWWFDNIDSDPDDNPTSNAGFYASAGLIPNHAGGGLGNVYGGYFGNNPPTETAISNYIIDHFAPYVWVKQS